jgi:tetratricopeptide (TPR) repeat protein
VLDELVSARLIEPAGTARGTHSQYRFHDLIRLFARERLTAEESAEEQHAALERALGCLLFLCEEARHRYLGGSYLRLDPNALRWSPPSPLSGLLVSDPKAWFEEERASLVAGVRQAADAGLVELCWSLAATADALSVSRSYLDDWQLCCDTGLEAARQAGHVRGEAAMLLHRGTIAHFRGQLAAARRDTEAAAGLFHGRGDDHSFALAIGYTAIIDRAAGRLEAAAAGFEQALAILRGTQDWPTVAFVLYLLARVRLDSGDPDSARELLTEALQLAQAGLTGRAAVQVLLGLGEIQLERGQLAEATDSYRQALTKVRALGDRVGEANILRGAGLAALRQGQHASARSALEDALELADGGGVPFVAASTRLGLSELALASGDPEQAVDLAIRAAETFRELGASLEQSRALTLLSHAYRAGGDAAAAGAASAQAVALRASELPVADVQA